MKMKTNLATFNLILEVGPCRAATTRNNPQTKWCRRDVNFSVEIEHTHFFEFANELFALQRNFTKCVIRVDTPHDHR